MRARSIYLVPGIIILVLLSFLFVFAAVLVRQTVWGSLDLLSIISALVIVLLCLPLAILLWRTCENNILRTVFKSLSAYFSFLCASAILWFALPMVIDAPWITGIGKILMLVAYIPVLLALYHLVRAKKAGGQYKASLFIVIVSALASAVILLFIALDYLRSPGNGYDVSVFTLSILADIGVLALGAILTINYAENQYRYIFSMIILGFLLTFAGDCVSIAYYLGIYGRLNDSLIFYDVMGIFAAIAMLAFLAADLKFTTVEEVSRKLYDTEKLVHDLIEQSPDAICIFDTDGKAVQASQSFFEFAGRTPGAGLAGPGLFDETGSFLAAPAGTIAKVREGETTVFEESRPLPSADGQARHYSVKLFPTRDPRGTITSYILIATDISDLKRQEDELRTAKDEAELYLDLMSHDINNIHQVALGYLEVARERIALSDGQKPFLDRPYAVLQRAARLISNVSKLQGLKSDTYRLEPVEISQVLADAIKDYEAIPGKTVTFSSDGNGPCRVMANQLLRDVFVNLIGNAVKHTGAGRASISVRLEQVNENGCSYCRVAVEDDGPGIPDELKEKIFYRKLSGNTGTKGTGMGLYLVKTLMSSYNGTVSVQDRVPGDHASGARFVLQFNLLD